MRALHQVHALLRVISKRVRSKSPPQGSGDGRSLGGRLGELTTRGDELEQGELVITGSDAQEEIIADEATTAQHEAGAIASNVIVRVTIVDRTIASAPPTPITRHPIVT